MGDTRPRHALWLCRGCAPTDLAGFLEEERRIHFPLRRKAETRRRPPEETRSKAAACLKTYERLNEGVRGRACTTGQVLVAATAFGPAGAGCLLGEATSALRRSLPTGHRSPACVGRVALTAVPLSGADC
jgi:hypothetical protein